MYGAIVMRRNKKRKEPTKKREREKRRRRRRQWKKKIKKIVDAIRWKRAFFVRHSNQMYARGVSIDERLRPGRMRAEEENENRRTWQINYNCVDLKVRGKKKWTSIIHKIFNVSFNINPFDVHHMKISSLLFLFFFFAGLHSQSKLDAVIAFFVQYRQNPISDWNAWMNACVFAEKKRERNVDAQTDNGRQFSKWILNATIEREIAGDVETEFCSFDVCVRVCCLFWFDDKSWCTTSKAILALDGWCSSVGVKINKTNP